MKKIGIVMASMAMATTVALLSACGGGGGGGGGDTGGSVGGVGGGSDAKAFIITAVSLWDAAAGAERMLAMPSGGGGAANGLERLLGAPGAAVITPCTASGTLSTRKVDATTFTLAATNCRLSAQDNLVYQGTWTFTANSSTLAPDGSCATASCVATFQLNTAAARYGYGTATRPVLGVLLTVVVPSSGALATSTSVPGTAFTDSTGAAGIANGSLASLSLDVGTARTTVGGALVRQTLQMTSPVANATLTLGAQVTAALDTDRNGVPDGTTLTIPWTDFAP